MGEREQCHDCSEPSGVAHVCKCATETKIPIGRGELITAEQEVIKTAQAWKIAEQNNQKTYTNRQASQMANNRYDAAHWALWEALTALDEVEKKLKLPEPREPYKIREVHEGGSGREMFAKLQKKYGNPPLPHPGGR